MDSSLKSGQTVPCGSDRWGAPRSHYLAKMILRFADLFANTFNPHADTDFHCFLSYSPSSTPSTNISGNVPPFVYHWTMTSSRLLRLQKPGIVQRFQTAFTSASSRRRLLILLFPWTPLSSSPTVHWLFSIFPSHLSVGPRMTIPASRESKKIGFIFRTENVLHPSNCLHRAMPKCAPLSNTAVMFEAQLCTFPSPFSTKPNAWSSN